MSRETLHNLVTAAAVIGAIAGYFGIIGSLMSQNIGLLILNGVCAPWNTVNAIELIINREDYV